MNILEVRNVTKEFPVRAGLLRRQVGVVKAVQDVSFTLAKGETLGIVGESGCGKTTLARCLLRLIDPTSGSVKLRVNGTEMVVAGGGTTAPEDPTDIGSLPPTPHSRVPSFRRHVQMVFQDPIASLNPRIPILEVVGEPLIVNGICRGKALIERVTELLETVGMTGTDMHRYPHAFSGGQRQRIGIARALALNPELIIADEPVSSLDVSVRAQILNLLADLKERLGLSLIFIGHDLSIIQHICDRVAVMYLGRIVEIGETNRIFESPAHPYTEALLSAVPVPDPEVQRHRTRRPLSGEPPSPIDPPAGCAFHPRCPYAMERCSREMPTLSDRGVACLREGELTLRGYRDAE